MNVQQLRQYYPGSKIEKKPFIPDQHMLYFYEDPYYIGIPSELLSDRERLLLLSLLNQELPPVCTGRAQQWYNMLINRKQGVALDSAIRIRMILFQMNEDLSQPDLFEWRRALEAFFDPSTSFIYLSSKRGLIIEERDPLSEDLLCAIANTLENDFSVKTYFQIGMRYSVSDLLKDAFREESRLFHRHMNTSVPREVITVASCFFSMLKPAADEWAILGEIRSLLTEDPGWIKVIHSLWENQGNISLTAKHLFMHRNTLQYRIEKFYDVTGLSLKKMDGLTMAYLSTL